MANLLQVTIGDQEALKGDIWKWDSALKFALEKGGGYSHLLASTLSLRAVRPATVLSHIRESETTIKIKFAFFRGGVGGGAERKIVQNAIFRGKRHDNKILKVNILLSRNFVVMAQAPNTNATSCPC